MKRFRFTGRRAVQPELLSGRINRRLWLEAALAATASSALMAVVVGFVVLSQSARGLERQGEALQRQLSVGITSYQPLHDLQRLLQQAASSREVESALVVDQRGLVLAASNNALVGLTLPHVLQLPNQALLRELFRDCPTTSTLLTCLTRQEMVFHGPLPSVGGDALMAMRQYPLALEGVGRFGDRATLITILDTKTVSRQALVLVLQVFLAGLLPLLGGCVGLMLQLRRELIPELLRLAQIDALSGIYNRRAFSEAAVAFLARAQQAGLPMAMALIDVDYFKQINDHHGHDSGDQVIRDVSELLREGLRSSDLVGRLGGDEFAILVQLTSWEATQMLDRTRQLIHATPIPTREGKVVQVSLSIGLASTACEAGYDYAALMRAADAALYLAKNGGRGQVVNQEEDRPVSSVLPAVSTSTSGEGWQIGGIG